MRKLKISLTAPLLVLVIFILTRASLLIDPQSIGYRDNVFLSVVVLQLTIFCLPTIFYCKLKPQGYISGLRFRLFGLNKIYFLIISFLTMVVGCALINSALSYFGIAASSSQLYGSFFSGGVYDAKSAVYITVALALIPAVCEEFLFRSVIINEYQSSTGKIAVPVIFSALLFAMMHFSLAEFPAFFFSGLILAFVALITNSVLSSLIIHLANNIISIFLEPYIIRFIGNVSNFTFFIFLLTALFLVLCILLFAESERICYNFGVGGKKSPENTGKESVIAAIASPTFILCIAFFLLAAFGVI